MNEHEMIGGNATQGQAGFSLIELMLAMTLGLLMLAGLVTVVTGVNRNYGELTKTSQRLDNGRYALEVLAADIHHAGFFGEFYNLAAPAALPDPCAVSLADLEDAMGLPLQGYDAPAASPLNCLSSQNHVDGTDILVVRRASTAVISPTASPPPAGELTPADAVYLQTTHQDYVLNTAADAASLATFDLTQQKDGSPADVRRLLVHIYFISPCSQPTGTLCDSGADDGRPVPSLKRLELADDGTLTTVEVTRGIENLQIEYGLDQNDNGQADTYVRAPVGVDGWSDVMALQIRLLTRGAEPSAGHEDTKTYTLSLAVDPPITVAASKDSFKRSVVSGMVRATNLSSRREIP